MRVIFCQQSGISCGGPITAADGKLWVPNGVPNSIAELDATTGKLVRVDSVGGPQFSIAASGGDIWVGGSFSITELDAATGATIRVTSAKKFKLDGPSLAVADGDVWALNSGGSYPAQHAVLTEIDAATGALVRTICCFDLDTGVAPAVAGGHVWVQLSRDTGDVLEEIYAASEKVVKVISDPSYRLGVIQSIAVTGGDVWVLNGLGPASVTEVDASTGALERVISGPKYQFRSPVEIAAEGDRLWVTNLDGNTVTTFPAA